MGQKLVTPGEICQVAYFVNDIRAAAEKMHALYGAGPFFVVDKIELAWAELRGEQGDFVHSSAYGQWGSVMMELVQQDSEGASPFRDMYAPGQEGLHHVAVMVDSLPECYAHYANHGFELAARSMTKTGTEFAFVDTTSPLGHMTEVYEASEQLQGFYAFIREASISEPAKTFIESRN